MKKIKHQLKNKLAYLYPFYMLFMGASGHLIYAFQTYEIISKQSSENISLIGFTISFVSVSSWFLYGLLKKDKVLILVNIFGMLLSLICIFTILFFMN